MDVVRPSTRASRSRRSADGEAARRRAWEAGVERARAVGQYLEAVERSRRSRGRPRSPDRMRARQAQITAQLPESSGVARLRLTQELRDLERQLARAEVRDDLSALEVEFVRHAKAFGEHDGIEYDTWRAFGVPADVLARAGITPARARVTARK